MHKASLHDLSPDCTAQLRELLLVWYAENARELPWRLPSVPFDKHAYDAYISRFYRCLLSETMLQQTQVKTVIAYYTKWLEKFPTISDLASAYEEDVMACWAGLGYYSRAKRLQQAAQYLMTNFISKELELPREAEYWVKHVPGVGPYTAGAILSISFGISSAIVDGNVQRVLSRVLAIHGDTSTPKAPGTKLVWQRAAQLVIGEEPGNLNQSLMELGATICTPSQPSCPSCPIREKCTAYAQMSKLKAEGLNLWKTKTVRKGNASTSVTDQITDMEDLCQICPSTIDPLVVTDKISNYIQSFYPYKPQKKKQREETAIVLVVEDTETDKIYLEKKAKGLLAGLYDFPTILLDASEADTCDALIARHKKKFDARSVGTTLHLFTHIRRTSHVLTCNRHKAQKALDAFAEANETGKWVGTDSLATLGVSELCLKNWRLASGTAAPAKTGKRAIDKIVATKEKLQPVPLRKKRLIIESDDEETSLAPDDVIPCKDSVSMIKSVKIQPTILSMFGRPQTRAQ